MLLPVAGGAGGDRLTSVRSGPGLVLSWTQAKGEASLGATSGHVQDVREVRLDCDGDAVLVLVDQTGAACHTGTRTCFDTHRLHP